MSPLSPALCLAFAVAFHAAPVWSQPASAIGNKEKMETCKFGAAEQKLKGKAEQDFIRKCMANEPAAKRKSSNSPTAGGAKAQPSK